MSLNPELVRRALDLVEHNRAKFVCEDPKHHVIVEYLADNFSAETLHRFLDDKQVRHDPPDHERVCSCEE